MGIRRGFRRAKLPLDSGHVKSLRDGTRLHYHVGDKIPHIDKVDPERNWIGHILSDIICGGTNVPIKSYWTQRSRRINGQDRAVMVRKRGGRVETRVLD